MPRSGTSLAASIFAKQGFFVAADTAAELHHANAHNPGGYWEAGALIEANVRVFQRVGYTDHNTWKFSKIDESQVLKIATLEPTPADQELVREYEHQTPWVWKDPRLCYTLAYWWPLVNQESTRVLLVRRDAESIFSSFCRMGWREKLQEHELDVIERIDSHLQAAEKAIRDLNIPHVEINYRDYSKDADNVAKLLSDTFEVNLQPGDLGYTNKYNSSSMRGRARKGLEKIALTIPRPVRGMLKRILPRRLLRALFPGHQV